MASVSHCVSCTKIVSASMHALACDSCGLWQHRKCGTGVSSEDYKRMTRGDLNINWNCKNCQTEPKGKQGTKGQKQISEENKQTLQFYLYIILGVNAAYFIVQFLFFSDSFTTFYIVLSVLAVLTHIGCYKFMGSIVNSGIDLGMEAGMAEHAKDVLLLTAIIQSLSLVSNYFWFLWFIAPGYAFYLLWVNILAPWFFAEAPEVNEKKQKKMERKMKRH